MRDLEERGRPRGDAPRADADALADAAERLEILAAFTDGMVFEFDREGRYLKVWAGAPELLAKPPEEVVGHSVAEVLGPVGAQFLPMFREVFDTGVPASFEYTIDVPAGRRTFSCEARAHAPKDGARRTVTLLVRDVTNAKAIEGKLVQAERLAALGLLAASVGHEIRQPLAYLLSSVEVLERDLSGSALGDRASVALDNILRGAQRIAEITQSLDVFARQRRRVTTTLDVRRPLRAALDLCASELSGRARIERRLDDVPLVRGDEGELSQVFANLLLNAAQALPESGGSHVVTVVAEAADEGVRVVVRDTGCGMSSAVRDRIFDPFFSTRDEGGGTGLGLFITRNIVEAHGGRIDVVTAPGEGTTFTVWLPSALASVPPPDPVPPRRSSHRTEPRKVLVVDDEERFLASLRLALEDTHHVVSETDAGRALSLVAADPTRFDIVLCDLAMPGVDGVAFYQRMVELGVAERFVLMTGGAFTPRAADFLETTACPTIAKPFMMERLLDLLDDVERRAKR